MDAYAVLSDEEDDDLMQVGAGEAGVGSPSSSSSLRPTRRGQKRTSTGSIEEDADQDDEDGSNELTPTKLGSRKVRRLANQQESKSNSIEDDEDDAEDESTSRRSHRRPKAGSNSQQIGIDDHSDDENDAIEVSEIDSDVDDFVNGAPSNRRRRSNGSASKSQKSKSLKQRSNKDSHPSSQPVPPTHDLDAMLEGPFDGSTVDAMTAAEVRDFIRTDKNRSLPVADPTRVCPAGILNRMKLKNFMNFRNFEIKFNPNVNFIHGPNGAGQTSNLTQLR